MSKVSRVQWEFRGQGVYMRCTGVSGALGVSGVFGAVGV